MTLVDANVLLYAINRDAPQHAAAKAWLDNALSGGEPVGFAWVVLLAVLRLTTRAGLFPHPLTTTEATDLIAGWLAAPSAWIPQPADRHAEVLGELIRRHQVRSGLVPDTHLAALVIEHGVGICSADTDFARFDGVRRLDPTR